MSRHSSRAIVMILLGAALAPACARAPAAGLPSIEAARDILKPPFDARARELLEALPDDPARKQEFLALLEELASRPLGEADELDVEWAILGLVDDAQIAGWLDAEDGHHELAMRLVPLMTGSAGDWMCVGIEREIHAALVRQIDRREGARREAVMEALLAIDCQLGALAEPLLRMLSDERADRRDFAQRFLRRCKGGGAWLRGSLSGSDDVLAASLGDPARRDLVLELLASGSCRHSPKLTAAVEAELARCSDAERPILEAALKQVWAMPIVR